MTRSPTPRRALEALAAAIVGLSGCARQDARAPEDLCKGPIAERPIPEVGVQTFVIGPALTFVTETSARIMFETSDPCVGSIVFGLAGGTLSRKVEARVEREVVQQVELSGLSASTTYEYRAEACGKVSATQSFITAPPIGAPVRFGVLGDNRSFPEDARRIADALAKTSPHFVVHSGDVVSDGDQLPEWKEQFFDPMRSLLTSMPAFIAIGNHENNARAFYEYTAYPYDPVMTDHAQFGSNYSVSYGNVYMLFVDTNSLSFLLSVALDTELAKWVRAQVTSEAAKRATWRLAVGHHPAFTESWSPGACDRYDGTPSVLGFLFPLMAENGFQLYLTGHTHAYERGAKRGVTQIISGGGGADLDEICRDLPETAVVVPEYHYLEVEAGCESLRVRAVSVPRSSTVSAPRVLDEVVLERRPPRWTAN
ncbi:MAG: metallophosphoesterase [Deltaproteobacteria bacterium]|nr:metallophosphoesterase [Deltaproteobacteria bacterium]